jgi:hypothetical protein
MIQALYINKKNLEAQMTSSTTALDINSLIVTRQGQTLAWETNFEANYKIFSTKLALGIFYKIMADLKSDIPNPFLKNPILKKQAKYISLEITEGKHAREIRDLANMKEKISPFSEWLEEFASEPEERKWNEKKKNYRRRYFEDLMALVGAYTKDQLQLLLDTQGFSDLQIRVEWYRKKDQSFCNPSDMKDNCLKIEIVYKNQIQFLATGDNPNIEAHRVRQTDMARKRNCSNCALAIMVIVLVLFALGVKVVGSTK